MKLSRVLWFAVILFLLVIATPCFAQNGNKSGHAAAGAALSLGIASLLSYCCIDPESDTVTKGEAAWFSFLSTAALGIAKEGFDSFDGKGIDNRGALATGLGGIAGSALFLAFDF